MKIIALQKIRIAARVGEDHGEWVSGDGKRPWRRALLASCERLSRDSTLTRQKIDEPLVFEYFWA
ncbi:MAG: hypothetical protein LBJ64_03445 [Deltaproteobacteria bacterium]|jgi:hypothetical protein|nr:hypothetical protein [Deltaproteobacteria bacterium]